MSVPHLLAVLELEQPLPHVDQLVLIRLADYADKASGVAHPSTRTLATRCGLDRGALKRALERLEAAGLIARDERPGRSASDRWRLLVAPKHRESVAAQDSHRPGAVAAVSDSVAALSASRGGSEHPDPVLDPVLNQKECARLAAQSSRAPEDVGAVVAVGSHVARWARLEAIRAVSEDAYNTALKLELRDGLMPVASMTTGRVHR
jgi:hypothetical protein